MRTRSAHHRRNSSGGDVLEGKLLGDYASDYDEHEDDERDDDDKFAKAGGEEDAAEDAESSSRVTREP